MFGYQLGFSLGYGLGFSVESEVPPGDSLLVDYWAADRGVSLVSGAVDTWTGQKAGIVLTAPSAGQRPDYSSDASFLGAKVIGCSSTGNKSLANTAAGIVAASGTRPYTITVSRLTVAMGASQFYGIFGLGILATSDPHYIAYQTFGGAIFRPALIGVNLSATAGQDLLPHVLEGWCDGTNANARDNNTLYTTANAAALSANQTAIGLGRAASTNTHFANANIVFTALFSAKPSDAYITNLKRWLSRKWGTTP